MRKFTKKRLALGALALLVVAGAAFAYFTTEGEGEGTTTVGTTENIDVTATISGGPLYPIEESEAPTENATITLENNTKSVVKVQKVEKKEVKFDEAHESCNAGWFEVSPVTFGEELAPEGGTATKKGAVWLKNYETKQDACKGAEVTVVYKVVSE